MKNKTIMIEKPLFSSASFWDIGKGAVSQLHLITKPMAEFLKNEFIKDTNCLSGDILSLFEITEKEFELNNRRENDCSLICSS